jgi:hypothetical protein
LIVLFKGADSFLESVQARRNSVPGVLIRPMSGQVISRCQRFHV